MKLVLAIVSNDDSAAVSSALTRNGFQVTKLATTADVGMYSAFPVQVTVGGATVFVLNVERYEKV